jgi:hypothetical protein
VRDEQREFVFVTSAGRSPGAHHDSAVERSGGHLEGSALAGFGVGREPPWRPVGRELKDTLRTERTLDLPRVTWIGHGLDAAVGITQLEEVLHPRHRRPGDDQLPVVAGARGGAAKVEEVAGNADILAQPDAREPVPGIGEPERHGRPVYPGTRHGLHFRYFDHSHIVPGLRGR